MLKKYLKFFNLSKDFTLDELNRNYKKILKEYKIKDIDDELKEIFLDEERRINKYYEILLKEHKNRDQKLKVNKENLKSTTTIDRIPIIEHKSRKKNTEHKGKIINSLIIILIIGLFGYFLSYDNSKNKLNNVSITSNCEILLENKKFKDVKSEKIIVDLDDLIYCFREGGIIIKSFDGKKLSKQIKFKLKGDSAILVYKNKQDLIVANKKDLDMLISESKNTSANLSSKIKDIVTRVDNYNMLKSNIGIDGNGTKWRIDSSKKLFFKNQKDSNNFNRITRSINKYYKLNKFLKNNLPKSTYASIIRINNKISYLEEIKEKLPKIDSNQVVEEIQINECKNIDSTYNYREKYNSLINLDNIILENNSPLLKIELDETINEFKINQQKLKSCMCTDCIITLESNDYIKTESLIDSIEWNNYLSKNPTDSTYVNAKPKEIDLNQNSSSSNNSANKRICRTIKDSYFWKIKLNNLIKSENVRNKKLKSKGLIKEIKERVEKFRACRCKRCNYELSNPSLKRIIAQFFNEKEDIATSPSAINPIKRQNDVYMIVENMPEFPGGDIALRKFIQKNIRYPVIAKDYNITGKVYVSFIVDKQGSVTNVKIVRGVDKHLDAEALRVVSLIPKYKPGKQRGKKVRVMFTIPINFTLNNN